MDSDSWIRVILLAFLSMGAAYCAASEISYASVNKIRIKSYADKGDKRAKTVLYISDRFEQALTTLLVGNNITHIGFGSIATLIATRLWGVNSVKYVAVASAVFVFLVCEMIPKSYAKANSEKFALTVSASLKFLMKILAPVTFLFMSIGRRISRLFSTAEEPAMTEEEFYDIMETVEEEGVLDKDKQELVQSALNFDVITAGDIMTGRDCIIALDVNTPRDEILKTIKTEKYSRIPIYQGNMDNVVGILHARNFLKCYIREKEFDLRDVMTDVHFVQQKTPIYELLQKMSSEKLHMSMVTDNTGRVLGLVTVEDILEELVGEIWDEDDIVGEKAVIESSMRGKCERHLVMPDSFASIDCKSG